MKTVLENVFTTVLQFLAEENYVEHYFFNGTKIEANANRYTFVWGKAVVKQKMKLQFAAASIPGSVIGALLAEHVEGKLFFVSFGILFILIALLLLFKPNKPIAWPFKPTVMRSFTDDSGERFECLG